MRVKRINLIRLHVLILVLLEASDFRVRGSKKITKITERSERIRVLRYLSNTRP